MIIKQVSNNVNWTHCLHLERMEGVIELRGPLIVPIHFNGFRGRGKQSAWPGLTGIASINTTDSDAGGTGIFFK